MLVLDWESGHLLSENNENIMKQTDLIIENLWQSDALDALSNFVRLPAKSPDFDPNWEQNGWLMKALQTAAQWGREHFPNGSFEILSHPGITPVLFIDLPGTRPGRPIVFYGHFDKQPEAGKWSEGLAPFDAILRGDRLYGRGTADDGYSYFAALSAVIALDKAGLKRPRICGIFETCEESGSVDLPSYLDAIADRTGTPSLLCALDLGIQSKDRLWRTQSLRGIVSFTLRVEVLKSGIHSGTASGIVPSSFAVIRELLNRLENPSTGEVLVESMHVPIPVRHMGSLKQLAEMSGEKLWRRFPLAGETRPRSLDPLVLLLKNAWEPSLSVLGAEGLPSIAQASALLRPSTALKLSFRIPPGVNADQAAQEAISLVTNNVPSNANVVIENLHAEPGFETPEGAVWLDDVWLKASQELFGEEAVDLFDGATIGILPQLKKAFGECPFLLTGVLGSEENAHAPDENISLSYVTKLTQAIARVINAIPEDE